mmetsp:Transcript_14668/g.33993  ORF Transcript_14668/g.33993 Transcript_14668/m.33993 type:complete len:245 (-) Transcript_14668:989-1723(-)
MAGTLVVVVVAVVVAVAVVPGTSSLSRLRCLLGHALALLRLACIEHRSQSLACLPVSPQLSQSDSPIVLHVGHPFVGRSQERSVDLERVVPALESRFPQLLRRAAPSIVNSHLFESLCQLVFGAGGSPGHVESLGVPSLGQCQGSLYDGEFVAPFPAIDLFLAPTPTPLLLLISQLLLRIAGRFVKELGTGVGPAGRTDVVAATATATAAIAAGRWWRLFVVADAIAFGFGSPHGRGRRRRGCR